VADPRGFLKYTERELPERRPVDVRIGDWREVYGPRDPGVLKRQAPGVWTVVCRFATRAARWATSFPSGMTWSDAGTDWAPSSGFTRPTTSRSSRAGCVPAPCESACVLGNQPTSGHHQAGRSVDHRPGLGQRVGKTLPPERLTGKTVAVVGSGPAGWPPPSSSPVWDTPSRSTSGTTALAACCATASLTSKWKSTTSTSAWLKCRPRGLDSVPVCDWHRHHLGRTVERYDAVVVATGAPKPRDLPIPGRDLLGIHYAMDYLVPSNKWVAGDAVASANHR
jgi:glutamate synthase (NADPH/NADH) small chain